jgi:hypothetical protein
MSDTGIRVVTPGGTGTIIEGLGTDPESYSVRLDSGETVIVPESALSLAADDPSRS